MGTLSTLAPVTAAKSTVLRWSRIEKQLQRFDRRFRLLVSATAQQHQALADLAFSFPALLFVVAVKHPRIDAQAIKDAVLQGQSLKALAKLAGLPFWLRKLPPQAFVETIGPLPADALVTRQIMDTLTRRERHAALWLQRVSEATRWGTDSFALWVARLKHDNKRKLGNWALRQLALWAWYSSRPDTEAGKYCRKPFHLRMSLKGAIENANDWADRVNLHMLLKLDQRAPRLQSVCVDGFDFIHLANTDLIADEAIRMGNCIMGYGHDITHDGVELWSVRKRGASLATLSIGRCRDDGLAEITQIKGPQNKNVPRDVALAARRWFNTHDLEAISPATKPLSDAGLVKIWQTLLKPYWLAKREPEAWPRKLPEWFEIGSVRLWQ